MKSIGVLFFLLFFSQQVFSAHRGGPRRSVVVPGNSFVDNRNGGGANQNTQRSTTKEIPTAAVSVAKGKSNVDDLLNLLKEVDQSVQKSKGGSFATTALPAPNESGAGSPSSRLGISSGTRATVPVPPIVSAPAAAQSSSQTQAYSSLRRRFSRLLNNDGTKSILGAAVLLTVYELMRNKQK